MTGTDRPQLMKKNRRTHVGAVVTLHDGFWAPLCMKKFVEEARTYKRRIYVRTDDGALTNLKEESYNVGAEKGDRIEFIVVGTDARAERIALRLYSGVTSENSYKPYFGRFDDFDSPTGNSLLFGSRRC